MRGEVFTEFSRPPFDRDALIHATEGMTASTRGDDPPAKGSSADDPAEPRATENREPIGQGDE